MHIRFPATEQLQNQFRAAYEMIETVGEFVVLRYRLDDGGYDDAMVKGKVSELRLVDIVAGSTARVGDLRVILHAKSIPLGARKMESKDRVNWRGREYAVVQYDNATASIGGEVFGVSIIVRG